MIIFLVARMMQNYFYLYHTDIASIFMKLNAIIPSPLKEQTKNIINYMNLQTKDKTKTDNFNKIIGAWLSQHSVKMLYQDISEDGP